MRLSARALVLLVIAIAGTAAAGPIDRVEPPFWWTGFEHDELQIMIHGHGTAAFDVSIDHPGVTLDRVERVDSQNYLFIYVVIDDSAKPGTFDIVLENDEFRVAHEYLLREKNPDPSWAKGVTPADVMYLITPDRFVNGDPSNDTVDGLGDDLNRDDNYGRHGGDIAGIEDSLDYLQDIGITALWINPLLENRMPEASYHGYSTTDFYKVDPRFGSNEQYLELADEMRARGMGLVKDMILNHIGSEHWWMHDMPTDDWLNLPDTRELSSHARTTNQDPYASDFDKSLHADGWFVDTMPDLNQRNPLLADYLTQNAIWWIEYLGLAGIRMDTQPYPDKHYMAEWSRRIMQEYPDFILTGEEWSGNPQIVSYWQHGKYNGDGFAAYMPSMLDFPVQIALHEVLTAEEPEWGSVWTPVYEMLMNDVLYPEPAKLVTFPDNHDMDRIFTQLDEDFDLWKMAIAYYATMRGIPTYYYGTEILMSHPGTSSHGALRAEFPGGWDDHDRNAFTGEGLSAREREAQAFMKRLLTWRRDKQVIHNGKLMHFTPMGNVYVYFRYNDLDTVMVVYNRGHEAVSLETDRFAEQLEGKRFGEDVITGKRFGIDRSIHLEPRSVMILEVE